MHIFWARLASFGHSGLISDPLIVSMFHNETHDPKGQENKIYTIVKGRETFYRRQTVPDASCSEVKYVLKRISFGNKDLVSPNLDYYKIQILCVHLSLFMQLDSKLYLSVTSHINCIVARCLINVVYLTACCLYQVMMTLHFLNDVANDAESTQK